MPHHLESIYEKYLASSGVSIDTRSIENENIFIAVNGPNFNANEFAEEALEKGALYALVDQEVYVTSEKTILVENGLGALQQLAALHRAHFKGSVLAITGSNGKTTTKELIASTLSGKYSIYATKGNLNNHIGVPLTFLGVGADVDIVIIEMGANHIGEIASYCEIVKPTHGLITNIGRAHTETFGGIEGVIRGKSELFDFLRKTEGTAFVNTADLVLNNMAKRFSDPVLYPDPEIEIKAENPFIKIHRGDVTTETSLIGSYNTINIAAALAVGKHFEVSVEKMINAIASYAPDNSRSQLIYRENVTIILDAYNANPDSMKAALEHLSHQNGERLAVLGDMNEQENSDEAHQEVLSFAKSLSIRVLTVGNKIGRVADPQFHFLTKEDLEHHLSGIKFNNATVLLKASRSICLETVVKSIK